MAKTLNERQAENCPADMSDPPRNFLSTLILELRGTKLDETWTQGSPQHKEQVPKVVFFQNSKISLSILDELKESTFWRKREKSSKSKGLEP
jgi:hypothetical protein